MSTKRHTTFPSGVLSLAAIVSLLAACAPAKRIPYSDIGSAPASPSLTIKKDVDMVRLEGILPSFEQVDRVYKQAASLFDATMVINDIIIDASVADAEWLEPVLATVEGVSHIDDFSVMAANGQMLVGGSVASTAGAESIESMASDFAGLDLAVTSKLMVLDTAGEYEDIDLSNVLLSNPPLPPALVEQPVVAIAGPNISKVATALRVLPESADESISHEATVQEKILEAANDSVKEAPAVIESRDISADADNDGVPDFKDHCTTHPGYPVSDNGCQLLDGFLEDVAFTDQPAAALVAGTSGELDEIVGVMQDHPKTRIAVISYASGHSDIQRATARKRAFLITSYLKEQGIDNRRMETFALANQPGVAEKIMIKEID